MNLGWKLAQVVKGVSPDSLFDDLFDSYHAERHPVGARVLRLTMASAVLRRPDDRTTALRVVVAGLLDLDAARRQLAGMLSGLDIAYDLGAGHPLLGRRMPDLDLITETGPQRVFALLHDASPLLLTLGAPPSLDLSPWADRVCQVAASCDGPWELPVLGRVPPPTAVLIRPDGHVAWVGDGGRSDFLAEALTRWFGPPAAA